MVFWDEINDRLRWEVWDEDEYIPGENDSVRTGTPVPRRSHAHRQRGAEMSGDYAEGYNYLISDGNESPKIPDEQDIGDLLEYAKYRANGTGRTQTIWRKALTIHPGERREPVVVGEEPAADD